jgi:hypothetical protein
MTEDDLLNPPQKTVRVYASCQFQRPCWKTVRAPIARKNKIYLPYICSYQQEGDLEKCGIRDKFIENEAKGSVDVNGV